jgi:hypothetical protein
MTNSHRFFRPVAIIGILVFLGAVLVAVAGFNAMQAQRPAAVETFSPAPTESAVVPAPVESTAPEQPVAGDIYDEASAFVASLPATQADPSTDYDRKAQFGDGWIDVDGNGCDTRNDILKRDFASFETFRGDCEVQVGVLNDVYTGKTIDFVHTNAFGKNTGDSMAVQIDHVIPLSWAWQNGAESWDQDTRILFANDPINLKAVDGPQNGSKSDQGPSTWMPASASYHCTYAVDFTSVLQKYELTIPAADQQALTSVLAGC